MEWYYTGIGGAVVAAVLAGALGMVVFGLSITDAATPAALAAAVALVIAYLDRE